MQAVAVEELKGKEYAKHRLNQLYKAVFGQGVLNAVMSVVVVVYFAVCFTRYFFADSFILVINGGFFEGKYYETSDFRHSILRWAHYMSYVIYPIAIFCKSRLFKNFSIFLCLPITIFTAFHFNDFIAYYMAAGGRGIVTSQGFREFYLGMELTLALVLPILMLIDGHFFAYKDKQEWINFFVALPFVVIALVPVYIPQSIIGYTDFTYALLTVGNFLWVLLMIIQILILNVVFRFKPFDQRYTLCVFLALAVFAEYNSLLMMGISLRRLPFQLCNIATYFFIIALITRSQRFFNFVFIANVMGAILAILAPDTTMGGFAQFWNMHYLLEHWHVLVFPIVTMQLRIFKRLDDKSYKHLVIGFTCYFVVILIVGTFMNGYAEQWGQSEVNYFYLFRTDYVSQYLPILEPLVEWELHFGRFVLYPFFQFAVYAFYLFACLLFYFATLKMYDVIDDHFELRLARIDLWEKITGKKSKAQRQYID